MSSMAHGQTEYFISGYDFGYLVKVLSCIPLPTMEDDFFDLFSLWFPNVYDVKYMMRSCKLRGGLQDVAKVLDVRCALPFLFVCMLTIPQVVRIGPIHQAGSDSLLTASVYFKMRELYSEDLDEAEYNGKLYGLGKTALQLTNGTYDTQYGRSAITSAERERTPPRENSSVVSQQGQQGAGQQGMSLGGAPGMLGGPSSLPTPGGPGMGGFPSTLGSPYGAIPVGVNGAYHLRQIGVGGDR